VIIKVCGIVDQDNHEKISSRGPDMIGINFYSPSKRFIGDRALLLKEDEKRVGVFVKASASEIREEMVKHHLDYAQLHGDESVELCREIQAFIPIIKVFRINDDFDWTSTLDYSFADYFLFDTFTKVFGGSGKRFDWRQLNRYTGAVPFLLSGGISPKDVKDILEVDHPRFRGVDINSCFEFEPGIKNVEEVSSFIEALKI